MAEISPRESLEKLETALEEEQQRLVGAQDNIAEKITTTRQMLRACAGKMEKHKQELGDLCGATRDRLQELRNQIEDLPDTSDQQNQLDALNQTLSEKEETIGQLNQQLVAVEEKSNGYDARIHELEQQLADTSNEDASAAERIQELEATVASLKEDAEQGAQQVKEAGERNAVLEEELNPLREKLDALRPKVEETEAALKAKADEIEPLQKTIDILRTEHSTLEEAHANLKAETEDQQNKDAEHADAMAALEKELAEKEDALNSIREERDAMVSPETVAALEESLSKEKEARSTAEDTHLNLEAVLNEERAKHKQSALAIQLAEALKEAEEARETLDALQSQSDSSASTASPITSTDTSDDDEVIDRINQAAKTLGKGSKRSIGEILIVADVITEENLEEAIAEQRSNPQQHLGAILIEKDYASDVAVAQALALQCEAPFQRMNQIDIEPQATTLLNGRLAQQHRCLPFRAEDNRIHVAMANPMDLVAIEDVERATGKQVECVVVTETDMGQALAKYYA